MSALTWNELRWDWLGQGEMRWDELRWPDVRWNRTNWKNMKKQGACNGAGFWFWKKKSLAVTCSHSSGGHLRSFEWPFTFGPLRSLALLQVQVTDLAKWLTCGHLPSLAVTRSDRKWPQVTASDSLNPLVASNCKWTQVTFWGLLSHAALSS